MSLRTGAPMRRGWTRWAALIAVAVAAVLTRSGPSAGAATVGGPELALSSGQSSYRPGAAVPLDVTVTNGASTACALASTADGSLLVTSASRNGAALIPAYSVAEYLDGATAPLDGHVSTVAPGRSVTFTVVPDAPGELQTQTPVLGESDLVTAWSLAATGSYRFTLAYQVSPSAGDGACAGESNRVTVAFRIGAATSRPWLIPVVAGAAAVLLIALLVLALRRRRRARGRRGSAGVVTVLTTTALAMAALTLVRASPASAAIVVDPGSGPASAGNAAAYDACAGLINKFDPSLLPGFDRPGISLTIHEAPWGLHTQTIYNSNSVTINWDPNFRGRLPGDSVPADPCASLYHELAHARDHLNGTLSNQECDDTGISDSEVLATIEENQYRAANGLDPRQTYGGHLLPSGTGDCTPPSSKLAKLIGGWINGDPHLKTFDGQRYDFQAVGEFTAVTSTAGDLTVQIRQAAFETSTTVAVSSAVAMNVSGTHLGFYLADGAIVVHRSGAADAVPAGKTALAGGATLDRVADPYNGDEYLVTWSDGTSVSVVRAGVYGLVVTIAPSASRAKTLSGLLGNFDGDPSNDLALPGAKPITATFGALYPAYADGWRVTAATSLFDYAPGTSTATFTDRSFPARPTAALSTTQRSAALGACTAAGVTNPVDLQDCELDVALTGSAAFAISAAELEQSSLSGPSGGTGAAPVSPSTGQTMTATVSAPNSVAHVTFTATAGQRLHVQVVSTTLPNQCGTLTVRGPDDNVLATGCTVPGDAVDGLLLPHSGEYTIYVDPGGGATGAITLTTTLSQDVVVSATIDGPAVTATIAEPGAQAQVSFAASAGQKVFVDVPDVSLPNQCPLELTSTVTDIVAEGCISNHAGYIDATVLPATGTYTVTIDPSGEFTGSVTVRVIADHDQHQQTTVGGPPVTLTVGQPGAVSDLTFSGTAGEKVDVTSAPSASLAHACDLQVVAPDQSLLNYLCTGGSAPSVGTVTVPKDGTYTLVLDPGATAVGSVDLSVAAGH
jgi:hypothetical protein